MNRTLNSPAFKLVEYQDGTTDLMVCYPGTPVYRKLVTLETWDKAVAQVRLLSGRKIVKRTAYMSKEGEFVG